MKSYASRHTAASSFIPVKIFVDERYAAIYPQASRIKQAKTQPVRLF
jgi:hypothetical protein